MPKTTRSASSARCTKAAPLIVVSARRAIVYSQWCVVQSNRSVRTKTARTPSPHSEAVSSEAVEMCPALRPSRPPCRSTNERKSCQMVESPAKSSWRPRIAAHDADAENGSSAQPSGFQSYSARGDGDTSSHRP